MPTKPDIFDLIWAKKLSFLVVFFLVFLFTYALFSWLDFLPEPRPEQSEEQSEVSTQVAASLKAAGFEATTTPVTTEENRRPVLPHTINFLSLDRKVSVANPASRAIADLDAALLYGAVRHPDSAALNQAGTVFVLGHSSYLPVVRNNSFQAFNGIQNLRFGDLIVLEGGGEEYVYRVDRVYRASAAQLVVPIAGANQRLVLATCNSFGSADERFMVEAELVEVKSLSLAGAKS